MCSSFSYQINVTQSKNKFKLIQHRSRKHFIIKENFVYLFFQKFISLQCFFYCQADHFKIFNQESPGLQPKKKNINKEYYKKKKIESFMVSLFVADSLIRLSAEPYHSWRIQTVWEFDSWNSHIWPENLIHLAEKWKIE